MQFRSRGVASSRVSRSGAAPTARRRQAVRRSRTSEARLAPRRSATPARANAVMVERSPGRTAGSGGAIVNAASVPVLVPGNAGDSRRGTAGARDSRVAAEQRARRGSDPPDRRHRAPALVANRLLEAVVERRRRTAGEHRPDGQCRRLRLARDAKEPEAVLARVLESRVVRRDGAGREVREHPGRERRQAEPASDDRERAEVVRLLRLARRGRRGHPG